MKALESGKSNISLFKIIAFILLMLVCALIILVAVALLSQSDCNYVFAEEQPTLYSKVIQFVF